jgi:hypothetical protein
VGINKALGTTMVSKGAGECGMNLLHRASINILTVEVLGLGSFCKAVGRTI